MRKALTVKVYVNDACMAALLWNSLLRKHGGPEDVARYLADHKMLTLGLVRDLVRTEIGMFGTESVNCGAEEDYYGDACERLMLDYVRRAFAR